MEGAIKGRVEDIRLKRAKNGNEYISVSIDGNKYAVWDTSMFAKLHRGDLVEYKLQVNQSGYTDVTDLQVLETGNNGLPDYQLYDELRNKQIARLSCLKSASTIVAGMDIMPEEKVDKTIEVAKQFEKYVLTNSRKRKKKEQETPPEYKQNGTSPVQSGQPGSESLDPDEDIPF